MTRLDLKGSSHQRLYKAFEFLGQFQDLPISGETKNPDPSVCHKHSRASQPAWVTTLCDQKKTKTFFILCQGWSWRLNPAINSTKSEP